MMKNQFISQVNRKWRHTPRYHAKTVDNMALLDIAIQACLLKPSRANKDAAKRALGALNQALEALIEEGFDTKGEHSYSVEDYGCWECSVCMVAIKLNASFYLYDQDKPLAANPINLLNALRSWQILSPIAYAHDIFIDPVSVVSRGRVQLVMHRDYGEHGVSIKKHHSLLLSLSQRHDLSVLVCVKGHPVFGDKDDTHWIVLEANKTKLWMCDPSRKKRSVCHYRIVYVLCVYAKLNKNQQLPTIKT